MILKKLLGGYLMLSLAVASVYMAWLAWPVVTGREEILRWGRVELSSQNMQFFVGVIGAYVVCQWALTRWMPNPPLAARTWLYPLVGIAAGVVMGWLQTRWSLVASLG